MEQNPQKEERNAMRLLYTLFIIGIIYFLFGKAFLKAIGIFTDAIANFLQTIF